MMTFLFKNLFILSSIVIGVLRLFHSFEGGRHYGRRKRDRAHGDPQEIGFPRVAWSGFELIAMTLIREFVLFFLKILTCGAYHGSAELGVECS